MVMVGRSSCSFVLPYVLLVTRWLAIVFASTVPTAGLGGLLSDDSARSAMISPAPSSDVRTATVLVEVTLEPSPGFRERALLYRQEVSLSDSLAKIRRAVKDSVDARKHSARAFFRKSYKNSPQLWDLFDPEPEFRLIREEGNPSVVRLLSPDLKVKDLIFRTTRHDPRRPRDDRRRFGSLSLTTTSNHDSQRPFSAASASSAHIRRLHISVVFIVRALAEFRAHDENLPLVQPRPEEFFPTHVLTSWREIFSGGAELRGFFPGGIRLPMVSALEERNRSLFWSTARNSDTRLVDGVANGLAATRLGAAGDHIVKTIVLQEWALWSPKRQPQTAPLSRCPECILRHIDDFVGPPRMMGLIPLLKRQAHDGAFVQKELCFVHLLPREDRAGGARSGTLYSKGGQRLVSFLTETIRRPNSALQTIEHVKRSDADYCMELSAAPNLGEAMAGNDISFNLYRRRVVAIPDDPADGEDQEREVSFLPPCVPDDLPIDMIAI